MKKYALVIAVVLPLFITVFIKIFRAGDFRNDASRQAAPSMDQSNMVSAEQLGSLGPILVVRINDHPVSEELPGDTLVIPAEKILEKAYQRRLRAFRGSIVIAAGDPALSARIWMLLSQLGHERLYLLSESADNEILKYKFRPDTVIRPEL